MQTLERSETFTIGAAARLKLANIRGTVAIRAGEPGVITVHAVQHAEPGAEYTRVEIGQRADGSVHVDTRFEPELLGAVRLRRRQPCRVDYAVRVPPACALELSVVESSAHVAGLTGDLHLHTVSGNVALADLGGRLRLHTVSGEVLGQRLRFAGPVELSTVSGTLTLAEADLPAVQASTVSGDLRLQTPLGAGPYHFNSVSGDVYLSLPAGTRCAPSLRTLSGRLHNGLPASPAGGAAASVSLHSVSGDLWLLPRDEAAAGQPPADRAERPDRRAMLERLARGELSVDEAAHTLQAQ